MSAESPSFSRKLADLVRASRGGLNYAGAASEAAQISREYRSPGRFPNPPEDQILEQICYLADDSLRSVGKKQLCQVPWRERPLSKGEFLAAAVAFFDQHNGGAPEIWVPQDLCRDFVRKVQETAGALSRQVTLPEQWALAMEIGEGNILGAAKMAYFGSRAIARRSDMRAGLYFTWDETRRWRDCVANFEITWGSYGDPPGDTYHFWGGVAAGWLSEIEINPKDKLLNPVYRYLYENTADLTRKLRYGLASQKGWLHEKADKMGLTIGRELVKRAKQQMI
jgi:hypothetical protein